MRFYKLAFNLINWETTLQPINEGELEFRRQLYKLQNKIFVNPKPRKFSAANK